MNSYSELRKILTLEQRLEIDRLIRKTWIRYLPEHTPSGGYFRAKFKDYAKEFKTKYAKDPASISMQPYKIKFLIECYRHSEYVRARKLKDAGYTVELVDQCLADSIT